MADSAIWVKVFPSTSSGDTGGPGWDVLTAVQDGAEVKLTWPAAGGSPTGYEVVVDGQIIDVGNVLTYTTSGISFGNPHTFKVRAYDAGGLFGGWSSSKTVTPQWNAATGGTEETISNYNGTGQTWKIHKFLSSGTLTVTRAAVPFRVLAVGGGGQGGGCTDADRGWQTQGGHGGGGEVVDTSAAVLTVGAVPVTVGASATNSTIGSVLARRGGNGYSHGNGEGGANVGGGGGGCMYHNAPGDATVAGQGARGGSGGSMSGGGGGGGGGPQGQPGGTGTGGVGTPSNITGASVTYGNGAPAAQTANTGNGGNNRGTGAGLDASNPGMSGIVVVAYRIG